MHEMWVVLMLRLRRKTIRSHILMCYPACAVWWLQLAFSREKAPRISQLLNFEQNLAWSVLSSTQRIEVSNII